MYKKFGVCRENYFLATSNEFESSHLGKCYKSVLHDTNCSWENVQYGKDEGKKSMLL